MTASSGPPGSCSCCRATVTGSSADGTAHIRAATDEHRHAAGDRHRRKASDAARQRVHLGSGAAGWLGCAPDLAGPGRSLLRPQAVPASGERRRTQGSCRSGSGKAVVGDPWTVPPHRKLGQPDSSCSGERGGCRWRRSPWEADHEIRGRPARWRPPVVPAPVCGLSRQLRYSACRPTAVVVPLPGQLPRHGKPGVRLGELQLSAPQVLLDVEVGPTLLSVDLLVQRLAADERLVAALHGVVPGQLPPLRHGSPLPRQVTRTFSPGTTEVTSVCQAAVPRRGRSGRRVPIDRLGYHTANADDPAAVTPAWVAWSGPRPCPAGPTAGEYGGRAMRLRRGHARLLGGLVGAWQQAKGGDAWWAAGRRAGPGRSASSPDRGSTRATDASAGPGP